jgi:hypothetical protein
MGLIG